MQGVFKWLGSVHEEREKKLRSLFHDTVAEESSLFFDSLGRHDYSTQQRTELQNALRFTLEQDYGPRELDKYYGTHPIRVARFLSLWAQPGSARAFDVTLAALVHNAIEKQVTSESDLTTRYGTWVAQAVEALTQNRSLMETARGKERYYRRLRSMDPEVSVLKYFDKFDNLFVLCLNPDSETREAYLKEIEEYIQPIGQRWVPDLDPYFKEMIRSARSIGYFHPPRDAR